MMYFTITNQSVTWSDISSTCYIQWFYLKQTELKYSSSDTDYALVFYVLGCYLVMVFWWETIATTNKEWDATIIQHCNIIIHLWRVFKDLSGLYVMVYFSQVTMSGDQQTPEISKSQCSVQNIRKLFKCFTYLKEDVSYKLKPHWNHATCWNQ